MAHHVGLFLLDGGGHVIECPHRVLEPCRHVLQPVLELLVPRLERTVQVVHHLQQQTRQRRLLVQGGCGGAIGGVRTCILCSRTRKRCMRLMFFSRQASSRRFASTDWPSRPVT
jgi:hypothetical protein